MAACLKKFFTYVSVLICCGMALVAYNLLFQPAHLKVLNRARSLAVLFLVPSITFLPLITHSYGSVDNVWCTVTVANETDYRVFVTLLVVLYLLIGGCVAIFLVIICKLNKCDFRMMNTLFRGVGSYALITLLCRIPRLFFLFTDPSVFEMYINRMSCYVSGILYTLVFLREKKSLQMFERVFNDDNGWSKAGGGGGAAEADDESMYSDILDNGKDAVYTPLTHHASLQQTLL